MPICIPHLIHDHKATLDDGVAIKFEPSFSDFDTVLVRLVDNMLASVSRIPSVADGEKTVSLVPPIAPAIVGSYRAALRKRLAAQQCGPVDYIKVGQYFYSSSHANFAAL